ncbi:cistern family PEP-CTERM protein [Sphingomonas sp. SRS2]|uniref:cistern family PEP-CTERM protein n=1 Tax=Sphingomonas sp. SRS2 TaxID=133190 RepID=UPI001364A81A|nr:cistern family PEP-CTERM protein [Sphingomonas sp. SRS2]
MLINRADVGKVISVDYAGSVLGFPTSGLSAASTFTFTGASSDGRTYNFSYALTNDSSLTSRVRSFGFDVLGNTAITGLSSTGTYASQVQNPLSGLIGTDICFTAAGLGGCTGGSGGLTAGQSGTGSFALTFANAMSAVQLSDFTVNYQGVGGIFGGTGAGTATAIAPVVPATPTTPTPPTMPTTPTTPVFPGGPVSAAPESSTWAMMMLGFGLVGWLLRRRPAAGGLILQN